MAVQPGYCQRGTADHRRNSPGGAIDRDQLRISAHDRANRIQPQSVGAGFDLVGEGALPVHRPDLARHHEAGRGGLGAWPLCGCHLAFSLTGTIEVADPGMRAAILRLRSDPQASAMLAGALTRNNSALVSSSIGRQPTNGELYIAHFLGADGAGKLINAAYDAAAGECCRDVSARCSGQSQHFLRRLRPRAQRRRGLQQADQAF